MPVHETPASTVKAWGVTSASSSFGPITIPRRATGPSDVKIHVDYCGMCHTDLHTAHGEMPGGAQYPCVPGHEISGTVTEVGANVRGISVGDTVGVGFLCDSCGSCKHCIAGEEQLCHHAVQTCNDKDARLGSYTMGGYAESITIDQHFVYPIPKGISKAEAAPLMCAGITTYGPLKRAGVTKGTRVGVVGLGGLGHMAIKIAAAMGADVMIITTSEGKIKDGRNLGAKGGIVSKDPEAMKAAEGTLDVIIDTVSAKHNIKDLVSLLDAKGQLVLLGVPPEPFELTARDLIHQRKTVGGSVIGSKKETQEMLEFCAKHGIGASVEVVGVRDVENSFKRMLKSDVKYRFVIDMSTLKDEEGKE